MDTARWYRRFAEYEARGSSPTYERLAMAIAASDEMVGWLEKLPPARRQPNLLFAATRFHGGPTDRFDDFVDFVQRHADQIAATMMSRSTQTNEAARCAAFVPVLAQMDSEVALVEIGASAGLCLFPDRYSYRYDNHRLGDSAVQIEVETDNTVPAPTQLPTVCWRAGLDLNPLDVRRPEDVDWLRACIWPEHEDRRQRLDLAVSVVASDPPYLRRGDLRTDTTALLSEAPTHAIKVVIHSAVLPYVDETSRAEFVATMRQIVHDCDDVVWLSNEAPTMIPDVEPDAPSGTSLPANAGKAVFHLVRDGTRTIAITHPHGRWLRWLTPS